MNAILDQIETILDGAAPGIVDLTVDEIPDYMPSMNGGGGTGGTPGC